MEMIDPLDLLPPPRSSTPSPRKGDQLFCNDRLEGSTAHIHIDKVGHEAAYIQGYHRGAECLVQHVLEKDGGDENVLIYPIVFLYRHHIELALKRILLRCPEMLGRQLTPDEEKHLADHRLDNLWSDLKPLIGPIYDAMLWREPEAADLEGINSYIRQLSDADPQSYSFRYSRKKKRNEASLPKTLTHINIRHFAEMMERLISYIDDIDTATSLYEEYCDEANAEYAYDCAVLRGDHDY